MWPLEYFTFHRHFSILLVGSFASALSKCLYVHINRSRSYTLTFNLLLILWNVLCYSLISSYYSEFQIFYFDESEVHAPGAEDEAHNLTNPNKQLDRGTYVHLCAVGVIKQFSRCRQWNNVLVITPEAYKYYFYGQLYTRYQNFK